MLRVVPKTEKELGALKRILENDRQFEVRFLIEQTLNQSISYYDEIYTCTFVTGNRI